MQTLLFLVLFSGSLYWMSASVFGNSLAETDAVVVTTDSSRTPASPTTAEEPPKPVELKSETIVLNPCSNLKGMPFKSYSKFGLGTDLKFYGDKESKLVPIEITPIVSTKLADTTSAGTSSPSPQTPPASPSTDPALGAPTTQPQPEQIPQPQPVPLSDAAPGAQTPPTSEPPQPSAPSQTIAKTPEEIATEARSAIAAFMASKGITAEQCQATSSSYDGQATGPDTKPDASTPNGSRPAKPRSGKRGQGPSPGSHNPDCSKPQLADSYVLAMSWQPAFCEKKPDKPECRENEFLNPSEYHNMNFALHGLWPNKEDCGINYGFCGEEQHKGSFAAYSEVKLTDQTIRELGVVMPSVRAKSYLERHEWYKHGTCSDFNKSADDYFQYAATLVEQFNQLPAVKELVQKNIGKTINKKAFFESLNQSLNQSLGENATKSMIFVCNKKGQLTEVQINLKKQLPVNPDLKKTIDPTKAGYIRGCRGEEWKIDAPGKQQ